LAPSTQSSTRLTPVGEFPLARTVTLVPTVAFAAGEQMCTDSLAELGGVQFVVALSFRNMTAAPSMVGGPSPLIVPTMSWRESLFKSRTRNAPAGPLISAPTEVIGPKVPSPLPSAYQSPGALTWEPMVMRSSMWSPFRSAANTEVWKFPVGVLLLKENVPFPEFRNASTKSVALPSFGSTTNINRSGWA